MSAATVEEIAAAAARHGLAVTGGFHPTADDGAPPDARTLLLLGYDGPRMWRAFRASPEAVDGAAHSLDRWSRRVVGDVAAAFGAVALHPFGGPPYQPFIRWTFKSEPLHQSKLGMAIHPVRGLWSGWRGALALAHRIAIPGVAASPHPCRRCAAPCRDACPVGAFTDDGYDVSACRAHLNASAGSACRRRGCLARRACPVGADLAQSDEQAAFHLEAFRVA